MKKTVVSLAGAVLLAVVVSLVAQETKAPGDRKGPPGARPGRGGQPDMVTGGIPETLPAGKSEAEKKILAVLDDMDKTGRGGNMNVPVKDGRLLRLLAESTGAKHVVELGTSTGYSGIWFCLALKTTGGKLTTFDIDEGRAAKAKENFKRAGVDGLVTLILGDAHQEVAKIKEPIDLLFLDADKEGYVDYLNKLLPLIRPGGLIVAHNITQNRADPKYLQAITTNSGLETLFYQEAGGVSITLKKRDLPQ